VKQERDIFTSLQGGMATYKLICRHLLWVHMLEAQAAPAKLYRHVDMRDAHSMVSEYWGAISTLVNSWQIHVCDNDGMTEQFTVLSVLGRGAQSVVYRARCQSTSQEVSLKLEPVNKRSQLLNEVKILKELAGLPGVPTLLSNGSTLDNNHYYSSTDVIGIHSVFYNQQGK
jgi:serine/threonine protein kinase